MSLPYYLVPNPPKPEVMRAVLLTGDRALFDAFLVPATLVPGTYHLEVRARMGVPPAGPDDRELRIGRLDATLTV